jgi:hypothetical protein
MKKLLFTLAILCCFTQFTAAQETEQVSDSVLVAQQELEKLELEKQQDLLVQKKIDKAEKARKKAEKAQKKAEKAVKKQEKLTKSIASKKKSIVKGEKKIRKLQSKLAKGKSKGKISPTDEMAINQKISKLKLGIEKDKVKLAKLQEKQ